MTYNTQGPFVQTAAICERVIRGVDGSVSIISLLDTWTVGAVGPGAPERMEPFDLNVAYVLSLKAGAALGRITVQLVIESPDGLRSPQGSFDATFTGDPAAGHTHIWDLRMHVEQEGLYWLDVVQSTPGVSGQERLLTRSPLRVAYQRH
ncbi:MAG: hypothetical protein NTZ54_02870 [Alphaproteobacteria bacterium]|nr:hypothetical protein [Alphaproteobacteria bacterium]